MRSGTKHSVFFSAHNEGMKDENLILIKEIRQSDEEVFASLLKEYHRMIYKIINSFQLDKGDFRIDENDLYQEACLALYDAALSFEADRNVQFSTYAFMVIRARLLSLLRNISRSQGNDTVSLDRRQGQSLSFAVNEDPIAYHREVVFREQLDQFMAGLNDEDRQILEMKNDHFSYKQIADEMGISLKRVDNRLRFLKKKLKKFIAERPSVIDILSGMRYSIKGYQEITFYIP